MFMKRRINLFALVIAASLTCGYQLEAYSRTSKTNSKGMQITAIQDSSFRYFQAEIILDQRNSAINSVIPIIAIENLFNRRLPSQGSPLLNSLSKLGNNCSFSFHPDHIRISLRFLPSQLTVFLDFLKDLYTYKHFKPDRFLKSKKDFWTTYYSRSNWLDHYARQVAYNHLFRENILGRASVSEFDAENVNFYQLLSYYHETFRPSRTRVYIKGNVNPHIVCGHVENTLRNIKDKPERAFRQRRPRISSGRQILIINSDRLRSPSVYVYRVIPPAISRKHLPELIINTVDFGIPSGRVYRGALNGGVRTIGIQSSVSNYRYFSVLNNKITKLQPGEIGYFLNLTLNISRHSSRVNPGREEFLRALKVYLGKISVKTAEYDNDLEREINVLRFRSDIPSTLLAPVKTDDLNRISYSTLSKILSEDKQTNPVVYIIAGRAAEILRHLKKYNPTIIEAPGS